MSPSFDSLIEQEFGLIADLIGAHARERPRHSAIIKDECVITYQQLDVLMDRVAASLQRDGLSNGDVIAICATASVEYAAVFLGALRAGVAVAPLAPSSTAESLSTMLEDCGAKLLFLDAPVVKSLANARNPVLVATVSLDSANGGRHLNAWLLAEGAKPEPVSIAPDAPFNIIYSSGTTGSAKGIVQPHRMRWSHVQRASPENSRTHLNL
jgi:acyl-CoA synthetase (AMP-forming)/AMP-acid ligase II